MIRWGPLLCVALVGCWPATELGTQTSGEELLPNEQEIESIYWSDGDSGRMDGIKFRLADVDAPETGGVGAAIGGADCESERAQGFESKAFMVETTRNANIVAIFREEPKTFDRVIVDFKVDGVDLAELAIEAGHLRPWPHRNGRALTKKPEWCPA